MPILEIVSESGTAFRCGIGGWFQSPEEKHEWLQLVDLVVQYAFTFRSATLITLSPVEWSIGHSLPEHHRLRDSQHEYLVNHIELCSAKLLAEIVESEDFQRGLLWLSALAHRDEEQLLATISQIDITSADPALNYELLLLLDDARRIHWLHPSRDVKPLEGEVLNIARTFRWQVSGQSPR